MTNSKPKELIKPARTSVDITNIDTNKQGGFMIGTVMAHYSQSTIYELTLVTHIELRFTMGLNYVVLLPITRIPDLATLSALLAYGLVQPLEC
jgi:hypothetical protein